MATENSIDTKNQVWFNLRTTLYIVGALVIFLFSIDLMVSSLQHLGRNAIETIILATSNPFTALFIGLLVTAMIQSSSTTTAMVVALVASGSITLESAVPIIMGANVGTTITSTIVSLGFINKKKEFRRAVSAGTYHDFFNILTVIILFPLEYYYGFLSKISYFISNYFFTNNAAENFIVSSRPGFGFGILVDLLVKEIPNVLLVVIAFALLFTSILLFRKLISKLLLAQAPEKLGFYFFRSPLKSFAWGVVTTAAIRSSTITTSLVVPLVAKRVIKLKAAAPFILGANIGTTITAFIAAILYTNTSSAITIAIVHFLFNLIGVVLFFPVPVLRQLPLDLANFLGKLTLKHRLVGLAYLLTTFFFIPFSLIYLNKDSVETFTAVYENTLKNEQVKNTRLLSRINQTTKSGQWIELNVDDTIAINKAGEIYPIYFRDNVLFVKGTMFMFSKSGFCWDGEDYLGKYQMCIDTILSDYSNGNLEIAVDSVYVFKQRYYANNMLETEFYLSPETPLLLAEIKSDSTGLISTKKIISIKKD